MNGVWNAPLTGSGMTFFAPSSFAMGRGGGDTFGRACDDDLSGSVEVRDPHVAVRAAARDLDLVVVEAEHRGHRPRLILARRVHRLGALGHELHALVERQRAGCDERGVLAEAVARTEHRVEAGRSIASSTTRLETNVAQLRVARVLQLVRVALEQEPPEVSFRDLARLAHELPRLLTGPRPPHPWSLRPLPGEREREHQWRDSSGRRKRAGASVCCV